jgi:hypothetical protein
MIIAPARVDQLAERWAKSGRIVADHGQPFGTALEQGVDNACGRANARESAAHDARAVWYQGCGRLWQKLFNVCGLLCHDMVAGIRH